MQYFTILLLLSIAAAAVGQSTTTQQTPSRNMMQNNGPRGQQRPTPEQMAQMEAQKQAYIATLSTAAQSAAKQIDGLKQQIDQIYNAQTPAVQLELDSIHRMGDKGGKGGMRMMNPGNNNNNNNNNNNQGR